jgi:phosphopantothenoylcysteine decarboxylase/phosphopantothenate--cysteine ligase
MRFLVTAGPTREAIDPVRFISNHSSGRMGYEVARALLGKGHEVVLVTGPSALQPPRKAEVVEVGSAREMLRACRQVWPDCDGLFAVAAVADYRPAKFTGHKLKREKGLIAAVDLVPNPDIVKTLARSAVRSRGHRKLVVGFALEDRGIDAKAEARRKLLTKGLDFVALNGLNTQNSANGEILLLGADGSEKLLGPAAKRNLARQLVTATISG